MFNGKIHYKWSFSIAMSQITRGSILIIGEIVRNHSPMVSSSWPSPPFFWAQEHAKVVMNCAETHFVQLKIAGPKPGWPADRLAFWSCDRELVVEIFTWGMNWYETWMTTGDNWDLWYYHILSRPRLHIFHIMNFIFQEDMGPPINHLRAVTI
jgi:hypothetical protein